VKLDGNVMAMYEKLQQTFFIVHYHRFTQEKASISVRYYTIFVTAIQTRLNTLNNYFKFKKT